MNLIPIQPSQLLFCKWLIKTKRVTTSYPTIFETLGDIIDSGRFYYGKDKKLLNELLKTFKEDYDSSYIN